MSRLLLPLYCCVVVLCVHLVVMVDGCDNVADITHCTNNLTMDYFYAGTNMTNLCRAADTFIRCVNAYPSTCRQLDRYFQGIRWLNTKVTVDDCPELLEDDVPANSTTTTPPSTTPTSCVCSAAPPTWSHAHSAGLLSSLAVLVIRAAPMV